MSWHTCNKKKNISNLILHNFLRYNYLHHINQTWPELGSRAAWGAFMTSLRLPRLSKESQLQYYITTWLHVIVVDDLILIVWLIMDLCSMQIIFILQHVTQQKTAFRNKSKCRLAVLNDVRFDNFTPIRNWSGLGHRGINLRMLVFRTVTCRLQNAFLVVN